MLRTVNSILHEFSDYRSSTMERAGDETGRLLHPRNGKVNNPDCYGGVGRNGGLLGGVGVSLGRSEKRGRGDRDHENPVVRGPW